METDSFGQQTAAGLIVGLSAVIYAVSYGALLFSGPLAPFMGVGIAITLIASIFGALIGFGAGEKTLIAGPDSNTVSILASVLLGIGAFDLPGATAAPVAAATVYLTAVLAAVIFYVVARARLSGLVRYMPFSVTAGFLASTGWLMTSGALNIIAGTPLTRAGLRTFAAHPARPELLAGVGIGAALVVLAPRVSGAVLIPVVIASATLAINALLGSDVCTSAAWCDQSAWLFPRLDKLTWLPPWKLDLHLWDLGFVVASLPAMLVVGFVGLLAILLSVASLELSYGKEFDLNKVLNAHAGMALLSALCGGSISTLGVARSTLDRESGGGLISGVVAAAICLATLFGAGRFLTYVPKVALGGLLLYLGFTMLKQWLWDQYTRTAPAEFLQILLIVALVANYGFMVGFSAGIVIACLVFVVSYARVPLASLATTLAVFASTVVRPEGEAEILREHGDKTLLYRLSGYVFFGSASRIEAVFQATHEAIEGVVIDFTNVNGIDSSATGVFQRILRRYRDTPTRFYFSHNPQNEAKVRAIGSGIAAGLVAFYPSLDRAVEAAEDAIVARHGTGTEQASGLGFLLNADRDVFLSHCDLKRVAEGGFLCAEGELSDEVFFIERGELEVSKRGDGESALRLAKLLRGAMVGELAFYTGSARSASIVAVTESVVYVLRRDALEKMRSAHPDVAARFDQMVIRKISRDLARTSKLVTMFS